MYFPTLDFEKSHRSYDNFLNESYLILYDDDTEDFEWSFVKEEFDADYLEAFEDALRRIIPVKNIFNPSLEDEAFWISDSKTFDSEQLNKKINRSIIRETPTKRGSLTRDFKFCRTKIVVGPANVRDSWIGDLDTLYSVKRIAFDLKQLVSEIPYSAMASPMVANRRMERFRDLSTHYIMLDFKKAGLTFPHVLLKSIKKILRELYPTVESFDYIDSFCQSSVYDNGTWKSPVRGTGLGNGNEIVTLAQCAVADILNRKLGWDAIIYNDDGVWKTDSRNQRRNMGTIVGFFKSLGFIVNYKKTFFSRRNIFCEEYWSPEDFWLKKQRFFLNIPNIFLSRTIFEAKKAYHQCKISLIGTMYDFDLDAQVKRFWGYEVHPFEYELPTSLGGWNFVEDSNLNSCFRWFERKNKFVAPQIRSHIDTAKRFMTYLTLKGGLDKFSSHRITYRKMIKEGMLDCMPRNILGEFERSANSYYGIANNDDIINQEIELLNTRSHKTSRPAIIIGLAKKTAIARKKLLKTFLRFKNRYSNEYTTADYNSALGTLRRNGFKSFAVPEKFYVKLQRSSTILTKRNLVSTSGVSQVKVPPPIGRDSDLIAASSTSLRIGKILPGFDIFGLTRRWLRAKEMIIRSPKRIVLPSKSRRLDAPNWLNMFTRNRLAAYIDSCTREQCDVEFIGDLTREFDIEDYANLRRILHILPITRNVSDIVFHSFNDEQRKVFQLLVYKRGIGSVKEANAIVSFISNIEVDEETPDIHIFDAEYLEFTFEEEEDHFYGTPDVEAMLDMQDFEDGYDSYYEESDQYSDSDDEYVENRSVRRVGEADYDEIDYDIYDE